MRMPLYSLSREQYKNALICHEKIVYMFLLEYNIVPYLPVWIILYTFTAMLKIIISTQCTRPQMGDPTGSDKSSRTEYRRIPYRKGYPHRRGELQL